MVNINWSMPKLVTQICDRLQNKFDVFLVIEGKRGLGKSTLGFKLMMYVKREMKRRGVEGYNFKAGHDILYTRKSVLRFFNKWQHSGLADEMINVTFNRDFYKEDQKDIIKIINMNRDHNNFFVACVPQFKVLDSQIKNLTCMKITVVRRGVAIVHLPNKTVYSSDIWDERVNEKIEREWLKSGTQNPRYRRLTTFRGFIKFPKLTEKQELLYQKIKDRERNVIMEGKDVEEKPKTATDIIYEKLIEGKIKNKTMLEGMGMVEGVSEYALINRLRRMLKENNKPTQIGNYYSDKKPQEVVKESKRSEIDQLIYA